MSRINIFSKFRQFFYTKILYINTGENRKGKLLINYYRPINYQMDVNPMIYAYNTGAAFGYRPGNLFGLGYSPQPNFFGTSGINGSLFSFGQNAYYSQNPLQTLLNATNTCGYAPTFGPVYNFGSKPSSGSIMTQKPTQTTIQSTPAPIQTSSPQVTTKPPVQSASYNFGAKQLNTSGLVTNAQKYLGCSEANNGHLKFITNPECKTMDPHDEEWCTDFVTYVTKETYKQQGLKTPVWFGSHDVRTLKHQAISHNRFIDTTTKTDKGKFISQNIKPGDIVILNQNGASHTGFVTKVHSNGNFETVEGNVGDPGGKGSGMVAANRYYAGDKTLSGFIRLA